MTSPQPAATAGDYGCGWWKSSFSEASDCVEVSEWWKASYSNANTNCVEAGQHRDGIAVRDTKDCDGAVITVSLSACALFLSTVR